MSGLDPNAGGALVVPGGGTSLPTATGADQIPLSDGAGTTYAATSAGDVVDAAIASVVGAVAGQAIVGDGLGGVTETSADVSAVLAAANAAAACTALGAESALPRLSVASALHHWRLDDAASPFADLGSGAATLAYVAGSREYGRAGVYSRYGATMQRSPAGNDHCTATISIGAATDLSIGITVANEDSLRSLPAPYSIIAAIHNNTMPPNDAGLYLLTGGGTDVYFAVRAGGGDIRDSAGYSVDWSRPHRLEATYSSATKVATLYVDGVARVSTAPSAGTMPALTRASIGGLANQLLGCRAAWLLMSDFTVHTSALSAATVLSRADVCRRLAGG